MKQDEDPSALKITQQFRSGEAMVYDLRGASGRLTVQVSGRGGDAAGPPTEWRVEVFAASATASSPDAMVAEAWAPTRAEALRAVGKSWDEKGREHALPTVDWESVARAMSAVRAI